MISFLSLLTAGSVFLQYSDLFFFTFSSSNSCYRKSSEGLRFDPFEKCGSRACWACHSSRVAASLKGVAPDRRKPLSLLCTILRCGGIMAYGQGETTCIQYVIEEIIWCNLDNMQHGAACRVHFERARIRK